MKHGVIFKQAGSYSCFPTLELLPDGRLLVAVTQRDSPSHNSKGRLRAFSSADGQNWQETDDDSLPPLWRGATGKFRCVVSDGSWLDVGAGGLDGHFDAPAIRPVSERTKWENQHYSIHDHESDPNLFYLMGRELHVGKSRDHGHSWQRQSVEAPDGMMNLCGFRGLRLRDARLLFPVGGHVPDGGWRQYMAQSTDEGNSWMLAPMAEDPSGGYTEEVTLLELDDSRLLAMIRVHRSGRTGYLWQQWSNDKGKTWSEPVETRIWGYPAHLLQLRDRRLLCTYGYRRDPIGIRAALSDDGGRSWNLDREKILRDDGGTPARDWSEKELKRFAESGSTGRADVGYPFSAELSDGAIVTVYYFTEADGITHAATLWRPQALS